MTRWPPRSPPRRPNPRRTAGTRPRVTPSPTPYCARAARRCFEAALEALPRLGAEALVPLVAGYTERFVARGRCPADERSLNETAGVPRDAGKEEARWT